MSVISPSEVTSLLSPVNAFLHCETPQSWINEAQKEENLRVELGYAITLHKAQGSQFPRIITASPSLLRHLLLTTRVKLCMRLTATCIPGWTHTR